MLVIFDSLVARKFATDYSLLTSKKLPAH